MHKSAQHHRLPCNTLQSTSCHPCSHVGAAVLCPKVDIPCLLVCLPAAHHKAGQPSTLTATPQASTPTKGQHTACATNKQPIVRCHSLTHWPESLCPSWLINMSYRHAQSQIRQGLTLQPTILSRLTRVRSSGTLYTLPAGHDVTRR